MARAVVRNREMIVTGLALVVGMHAIFLATGAERGPVYLALQALGLAGAVAALAAVAWAPARGPLALGAGLATLALVRVLHIVLELSRLPLWLNWGLAAAYAAGAGYALAWALAPDLADAGARGVRGAAWALGFLHFAASVVALSGGRLAGIVALAAGSVGFFLLAPNLETTPRVAGAPVVGGGKS